MRPSIAVLMASSLVSFHASAAQSRMVLPPPTRIRYSLPPNNQLEEAEVLGQRGDSLWVRSLRMRDTTAFALSTLTHLDVSMGSDRHVLRDAGIGLLAGVVVGGAIGSTARDETAPNCTGLVGACDSAGTQAGWDVGMFATLGAGLGAIVGIFDETDRWQPVVKNTLSLGMAIRPASRARTYDIGVRIRIF